MKPAKAPRYQTWSTKTIALVSLPMVAITLILVFGLGKSSAWVEWQLALLVLSMCLFVFLTIGLYRGVRLEKLKTGGVASSLLHVDDGATANISGAAPVNLDPVKVDLPGLPDTGDDLVGCLVTIVLWVGVTILAAFLVWLAAQILIVAVPGLLLGIYWVYYRALRMVFTKSRICQGKIGHSIGYGLLYTVLYMGWLFAVTWLGWLIVAW